MDKQINTKSIQTWFLYCASIFATDIKNVDDVRRRLECFTQVNVEEGCSVTEALNGAASVRCIVGTRCITLTCQNACLTGSYK
jgi:hypothetical protein